MSDLVSLMTDYVVVLTEKYDLLHLQLLDARQMIDKNHIVIERDKVEKGPPKCRSVSLVCPPTSTPEERRMSLQVKQEEKGRQGEDGEVGGGRAQGLSQGGGQESPPVSSSPAAGPPVRKRTKKCSMFETIEENQDCPPSALITSPRKSSKKVSIAENLNCDYSDCEYSEVGETGGDGRLEEDDDSGSSTARSLTTFFLELVVTLIFVLVSYTLSYPKQAAVIFLSFLIIYLMLTVIS